MSATPIRKEEFLNNSGIHPSGHRVLVLPDQVSETSIGGIVLTTQDGLRKEEMAQIEGTVIEIGPEAWKESKEKGHQAWCKRGDRIIFAKYSGLIYDAKNTKDGKTYRIISDLDVVAVINKE